MINSPAGKFKHIKDIIQKNYLRNLSIYQPKASEDYGTEGIKLDCLKSKFKLKNLVFTRDVEIKLKTTADISINSCVFRGSLRIHSDTQEDLNDIELLIFKSIIYDLFCIGPHVGYKSINVDCIAAREMFVTADAKYVNIYRSEIPKLEFEGGIIDNFVLKDSFMQILSYYHTRFREVDIDTKTFLKYFKKLENIKIGNFYTDFLDKAQREIKIEKKKLKNKEFPANIPASECVKIIIRNIRIKKELIDKCKHDARIKYLDFLSLLKKSKNESIDSQVIADLNYNYYKNKAYNPLVYCMMWALGFFYRPLRIIVSSTIIIFVFGLAYLLLAHLGSSPVISENKMPFNIAEYLSVLVKYIYFSGFTFYTIGYSDIMENLVNQHLVLIKQVLVLLEGCIGVICNSSIVVALLNKHRIRD